MILVLVLEGTALHAQVKVVAPISPNAPTDNYPTHIDSLGKGGFMAIRNLTIRDNISAMRRKEGMLVYVIEVNQMYQLRGGIDNSNWVSYSFSSGGGGGGGGINAVVHGNSGVDVNSSISVDGLTLTLNIPDASPTARGLVNTEDQFFAGNKTFQDGITIPANDEMPHKSRLNITINSNMIPPGYNEQSSRWSRPIVVDEYGTVMLAPTANRFITVQKLMDIKGIWDIDELDHEQTIAVAPGHSKELFVDFTQELQEQTGLAFWGIKLAVNLSPYLDGGSPLYYPFMTYIRHYENLYQNSYPAFAINFFNMGNSTGHLYSSSKILVTVTFDLYDEYLTGWYWTPNH